MNILTKIIAVLALTLLMVGCASGPSLQKYYIDNQDNENFISLDIPASVLSLKEDVPPEAREALASLKKFNILAFKKDEGNNAEFKMEESKVKAILKNDKFKELMTVKDKGRNIILKYEGNDDIMDEVIVYASDKEMGFALIRVLGDNMEPAKIMKLANSIGNVDSDSFKSLEGFFKAKVE